MSDIQARIKIKKSTVSGEVPLPAELEVSELALNVADRKIYSKDNEGNVFSLFGQDNSDIDFSPAAFIRSRGPIQGTGDGTGNNDPGNDYITLTYPEDRKVGDLLVMVVMTRGGLDATVADPDWIFYGKYLPTMANDWTDGPQMLSVFSQRLESLDTTSVRVTRENFVAGTTNDLMSGFIVSVGSTAGIQGITFQYDDGNPFVLGQSLQSEQRLNLCVPTYVYAASNTDASLFYVEGQPAVYTPGYQQRLAYIDYYPNPGNLASIKHYIDSGTTTLIYNHSGINITFSNPENFENAGLVTAVQGKVGNVRLNLSEMDDVSLNAQQGSPWTSKVAVTPAANGEYKPNLASPEFYVIDSLGVDNTAALQLISTGRSFWVSEDRVDWMVYEAIGEPVLDAVANVITLSLNSNLIPTGTDVYISLEDPASYLREDGDSLVWNSATGLWEAKKPEDAIKSIDDLVDVDTTTTGPISGDVLEWSGTAWVPGDGSGIVSVTSVNGQSGVVELGIADMNDYLSEGNPLEYQFNDKVAEDLNPSGSGQWSVPNTNTLNFSDRSSSGVSNTIVGPVFRQLVTDDSIWLSADGSVWTEHLLAQDPTTAAGFTTLALDPAWAGTTGERIWVSFQTPTTVSPILPEDGDVIIYDQEKNKYYPGQPPLQNLSELGDVAKGANLDPKDGDGLVYDKPSGLWYPTPVEDPNSFQFVTGLGGVQDNIYMVGSGLTGPTLPVFRNATSVSTATFGNNYAGMTVIPGRTYTWDLSGVTFFDPYDYSTNEVVRPWIISGVENTPRTTSSTDYSGTTWDPVTRIYTWTVPQNLSWSRYYIVLGTDKAVFDSYGFWPLNVVNSVPYSKQFAAWFQINLNAFDQDGNLEGTTTLNGAGNRILDRNKIPFYGTGTDYPHGKGYVIGGSTDDQYAGDSDETTGVPEYIQVYGPAVTNPDAVPLIGRVSLDILHAPPWGIDYQYRDFDITKQTVVTCTAVDDSAGGYDRAQNFFVHTMVADRFWTIDFHNVTGTAVLPDRINITIVANPQPKYRDLSSVWYG